ncbi:MAG TPA: amino acid permease C-terminal domain-containing protein, partial [Gemmatimonadaceae bacterium]|nr:amino acid permease C-terminal domain-containing protein [Gemmatimonadaceae bacterium]
LIYDFASVLGLEVTPNIARGLYIALRYKSPNIARPFRTPFVPVVPILGILICGYMMRSLPWATWERLIVWMIIGLFIYFFYSRSHSKLARAEGSA